MENSEIAKIFHEIADLLEIKGENPFRIRSYRNAALSIVGLPLSLKSMVEKNEGCLEDIAGVGKSIHEKIVEMLATGRCALHEELLRELPSGLLEILKIGGVGPKKVELFYKRLDVKGVEDLEKAVKAGKLRQLPGMGEKTEANILKAIGRYKTLKETSKRVRLSVAYPYAERYVDYLKRLKGVIAVEVAGSLRRWKETIGDVDILVACRQGVGAVGHFTDYPEVKDIIAKGETKATVLLKNGLQVDVRVIDKKSFGSALQYFTGSKSHNIAIRDRAKKMGLRLSEYGVFNEKTGAMAAGASEEDVYNALGLKWIPPELRENRGEVEAAEKSLLPTLIELKDIRGDLHVHTKYSDGQDSIAEISEKAMSLGYEYIAITDHSKAVGIAHGMDEGRLKKQLSEIDRFNSGLKKKGIRFRVIKGIEVDIKGDGTLDLDIDMLKRLDCVVGAVHSGFNMPEAEMTGRITKAMATGAINILAHPTGRLIGSREPYEVDMKEIISAAKKYNVYPELNSYPERLDLNDINCRLARNSGVMLAISTDSHSRYHLDHMIYGIHTARRGGLEKKDVLNTMPLKELLKTLGKIS